MCKKLDLNTNEKVSVIGKLTKEIIDLLQLEIDEEKNIVIWKDRIKYIEKHKPDFSEEASWEKHMELIPEIVNNPDYVGLHPTGNSIQFIKRIDKHILVAVRLNSKRRLAFRSSYPITEEKLQAYLKNGTIKLVKKNK